MKYVIALLISVLPINNIIVSAAPDINALARDIAGRNLVLKASAAQHDATISTIKSENVLPDPEIEFSHLWGENGIGNKMSAGISQSFDWPTLYAAKRKAAGMESLALSFLWKSQYLDTVLAIKNTLIDIIYAKRKVSLRTEIMLSMDSLYNTYKRGLDIGEVSIIDFNKIAIERIAASRSLAEASNQFTDLCASLQALNGGEQCDDIVSMLDNYPNEPILSLDHYIDQAKSNNPQMQYADAKYSSISAQRIVLNKSRYPSFNIGYNFDYEMGEKFNGFSIGMTLPIYSRKQKSKSLELEALEFETNTRDIINNISSEITATRQRAINYMHEIEDYKPIFESNNNVKLLDKAFAGGQISLMEYITDLKYFIEARSSYEELLYLYTLDASKLNRYALLPLT